MAIPARDASTASSYRPSLLQRVGQVLHRLLVAGIELRRDPAGGDALLETAGIVQRLAEIVVRAPRSFVVRHDVAEEGHGVAIDLRLAPGKRRQHGQHDGGEAGERRPAGKPVAEPARRADAGADNHGDQAEPGEVLKAVGDQGELHEPEVHEPQHRRQRDGKERCARQRSAAPSSPSEPQDGRERERSGETRPPHRIAPAHLPLRIDDGQIDRPQQLAGVEPQCARRDQHPFDRRVAERHGLQRAVERVVRQGDAEAHGEERREAREIRRGDAALLPPVPDEERGGERHHHRLRQQGGDEQHEHQRVSPRPGRGDEAQPRVRRGQVEQRREQVLALNDPGYRLDMEGMHGEHRRSEPGARNREPCQQPPHQHDIGKVQRHVDGVIARRGQPPQLVLQPERRVDDGPVVALARDGRRARTRCSTTPATRGSPARGRGSRRPRRSRRATPGSSSPRPSRRGRRRRAPAGAGRRGALGEVPVPDEPRPCGSPARLPPGVVRGSGRVFGSPFSTRFLSGMRSRDHLGADKISSYS